MSRPESMFLQRIEGELSDEERAFMQRCVSKMRPDQLERLASLSTEEAVRSLRLEMPFATVTTRDGTK